MPIIELIVLRDSTLALKLCNYMIVHCITKRDLTRFTINISVKRGIEHGHPGSEAWEDTDE